MKALQPARRRADDRGFSLVELIIVIAIMAALIAILAPQFVKYIERSRVAADEATADELLRTAQVIMADETYASYIVGTGGADASVGIRFAYVDGGPTLANNKNSVGVGTIDKGSIAITSMTATKPPTTQLPKNPTAIQAVQVGLTQFLGDKWPYKYKVQSNTYKNRPYTVTIEYKASTASAPQSSYTISGEWEPVVEEE